MGRMQNAATIQSIAWINTKNKWMHGKTGQGTDRFAKKFSAALKSGGHGPTIQQNTNGFCRKEVRTIKQVLWISRHTMTPDQKRDLDRALGDETTLLPWRDSVRAVQDLAPLVARADAVAAVLPPDLLAQLVALARPKPVLRSVAQRTVTETPDSPDPAVTFRHLYWEQILRITLETRRL
jgi:hypothetical protein